MRVLVTGASGFLGKILVENLRQEDVLTLSKGSEAMIRCNIASEVPIVPYVDIVVHAAGKAHSIPKTISDRQEFFDVNFTGTRNLLKGLKNSSRLPKSFIFISTVAVYGRDSGYLIREDEPLLAKDPYGLSKIKAEELVQCWCNEHGVICSILRLPLLAGPNPPGNLGSMIRGIKKGYYFNVAGGKGRKSIVLAVDVAKIIPVVAEVGGIYNLTDGYSPSFAELSLSISIQLKKSKVQNIPLWLAKVAAKIGDLIGGKSPINSYKLSKITSDLTFDDSFAKKKLGWSPTHVLKGLKLC